jgi:hypothetical protein
MSEGGNGGFDGDPDPSAPAAAKAAAGIAQTAQDVIGGFIGDIGHKVEDDLKEDFMHEKPQQRVVKQGPVVILKEPDLPTPQQPASVAEPVPTPVAAELDKAA